VLGYEAAAVGEALADLGLRVVRSRD
jgi:hypothetical protein